MTLNLDHRIVEAQQFKGDLIVTFSDSRCGLFPAEMLYELLEKVEQLDRKDEDQAQIDSKPDVISH